MQGLSLWPKVDGLRKGILFQFDDGCTLEIHIHGEQMAMLRYAS